MVGANDAEEGPAEALPRELGGRHRPRWEEPPSGAPEGTQRRLVARDTLLGRDLDLVRLPFGADRRSERDQLISTLRARTTVLAPALVAVHDAGEWEEDAFVLLEPVVSPVPLREAVERLEASLPERVRWVLALAEAAEVLDGAGLSLAPDDWGAATIDAYRAPHVVGLERAGTATDDTRRATVLSLADLLSLVSPQSASDLLEREVRHELDGIARLARLGRLSIAQIRERLSPLVGAEGDERPLLPHIDPESLRRREAGVLLAGLGLFVLSFVVLIVVLLASR